jgi:4-hydroxy-tetrahydrodipicolinate synthase
MAEIAEDVGVDALSVLTPMFISPSQSQLCKHFETIAKSTKLPVVLYNYRPKIGVDITPDTVAKLADIDNIVAVKDSAGDMTNTEEYIRLTREKDFSVLMGRDTLIYAALCYGATGAIASCANVAPRIAADIYDKYKEGDLQGALEAQFKLAALRIAFNLGIFPAVINASLEMQGVEASSCFEPVGDLTIEEEEKFKRY